MGVSIVTEKIHSVLNCIDTGELTPGDGHCVLSELKNRLVCCGVLGENDSYNLEAALQAIEERRRALALGVDIYA